MQQRPVLGPEPWSIFVQMGTAASYAVPLLLTAVALVGYALRDRDAAFAFAGGLLLAVAATAGYLLSLAKMGTGLDAVQWVRLAQLNAAVVAMYSLAWMALVIWTQRGQSAEATRPVHPLLTTLVGLAASLQVLIRAPATAKGLLASRERNQTPGTPSRCT